MPHCPECGAEMKFVTLDAEGEFLGDYMCLKCGFTGRPKELEPQTEGEKLFNKVFRTICGVELDDFFDYLAGY
jgi:ssDNA-binding Zn-finger/Zn-ribbon topoisomerase 1